MKLCLRFGEGTYKTHLNIKRNKQILLWPYLDTASHQVFQWNDPQKHPSCLTFSQNEQPIEKDGFIKGILCLGGQGTPELIWNPLAIDI